MPERKVLRVVVEAPITSFRHPHFLIARQPTFDMPPPSTIYGHVASALGELPDPKDFRFAYHFEVGGRGSDLEHQHIVYRSGGKVESGGKKYEKNIEGNVQPQYRDFLFQAKLTLYLEQLQWADKFREPVFCVVLGRSQDLAQVTEVAEVAIEEAEGAYLEGTLLPFAMRARTAVGVSATMPRYIGPGPEREAVFERYVVLRERLYCGVFDEPEQVTSRRLLEDDASVRWWVDPETEESRGVRRGLVFHEVAPG